MDKRIKTPMIIAIILQGIAFLIGLLCYLFQGSLSATQNIHIGGNIFPGILILSAITLLLHIIALLVMQTYEGESRRMIGGVLAAVYCVVNVLSPIVSRIGTYFDSRKGAEFLAGKSILSSFISTFSAPFTTVAFVLVLIAVGRYSVLKD